MTIGLPRCAVTGMGIVSAAGPGAAEFREAIFEGRGGAREVSWLRSPRHQPPVAAPVRDEHLRHVRKPRDRAFELAEQAAAEALAEAGLGSGAVPGGSGLVVGTTLGGAIAAQEWHAERLAGRRGSKSDLVQAPLDGIADHLARRFVFDGPRTVVSNACVSGTDALGLALDLIRAGEAKLVLAGGVDSLHDFNFTGFANLGALARDRGESAHPAGRGMLLGEAAAFLVLESADAARNRGVEALAELAGYGSACDAFHVTAPSRDGLGAQRAITEALADAGVEAEEVDVVLLHGVGTAYMDGMESCAMARLFDGRQRRLPAVSLRPVTGHTLGSVGAVDTIACVMALREGRVPPTGAGWRSELSWPMAVERRAASARLRIALNTSSGFGGVNAALILRGWTDEQP